MRQWGLRLVVCAALLSACVRNSRPPECNRLEDTFAEAKQAWLQARFAGSDPSGQDGATITSSEEKEIADLRTEFETRQSELFESGCVTE
jgi:hypothetical protein